VGEAARHRGPFGAPRWRTHPEYARSSPAGPWIAHEQRARVGFAPLPVVGHPGGARTLAGRPTEAAPDRGAWIIAQGGRGPTDIDAPDPPGVAGELQMKGERAPLAASRRWGPLHGGRRHRGAVTVLGLNPLVLPPFLARPSRPRRGSPRVEAWGLLLLSPVMGADGPPRSRSTPVGPRLLQPAHAWGPQGAGWFSVVEVSAPWSANAEAGSRRT